MKNSLELKFLTTCQKGKVEGFQSGLSFDNSRPPDGYSCNWCYAKAKQKTNFQHKVNCLASTAEQLLQSLDHEKVLKLARRVLNKLEWNRIIGTWRYACPTCNREASEHEMRNEESAKRHDTNCLWTIAFQLDQERS
ncbi:MAG: hypothetical protein G01um101470_601 [Parcubacteria group bacterium Gr01-1014_70]|nr:MAG: hypothetical protein G01um101470_601 [Parcubacteria group bacterium Gr01-1014_70]